MLQAIRDRATGWIAYGIVGFLVIPFAFWGIDQYQGGGQVNVAEVEGIDISLQEFQRAFQQRQARLQSILGDRFDPAILDDPQLKREVLDELINARLMTTFVAGQGYRVGDAQLARAIHEMPPFQVDGRFDATRYEEVLRRQGFSKTGFEEGMRADLASMQVQMGVSGTYGVPDSELDRLIALRNQRRDVSYAILNIAPHLASVSVADEELAEWFAANSSQFVAPEEVRLSYVELNVDELAAEQPVDEDALLRRYGEQQERFVKPAVRRASHVLVRVDLDADQESLEQALSTAQKMADDIEAGSLTFDEAMAQAGVDDSGMLEAGELGAVTPGMMDEAFESALYGLAAVGDVSEPVQTDFGFHLVRLDGEDPGGAKTFEEVRDELAADMRREEAEGVFFELADQLATIAYETPDSLGPVADELGLSVEESEWLSRDEGEGIATFPRIREAAFEAEVLDDGLNSRLLELTPTHVVVLRVEEHRPARERELDEVRDQALGALRLERAEEALEAQARALLEAARAGEDLETLAADAGAEWLVVGLIQRSGGGADRAIVEEAFRMPAPNGSPSLAEIAIDPGRRAIVQVAAVEGWRGRGGGCCVAGQSTHCAGQAIRCPGDQFHAAGPAGTRRYQGVRRPALNPKAGASLLPARSSVGGLRAGDGNDVEPAVHVGDFSGDAGRQVRAQGMRPCYPLPGS